MILEFLPMWGEIAMKRTPLRSSATETGCVLSLYCTQGKNYKRWKDSDPLVYVTAAFSRT